jgi:hypothetical protein
VVFSGRIRRKASVPLFGLRRHNAAEDTGPQLAALHDLGGMIRIAPARVATLVLIAAMKSVPGLRDRKPMYSASIE